MRILSADIGGTQTKLGLCDEHGNIERFTEYSTESARGGPHVIKRLMEQMSSYSGYDRIAISTAGQVNAEEGSIVYANANIPDYTGMQISKIVGERFDVPVKVENDVNAAALGEARYGAGKDIADFLCLTFGTGIGGAIVINNRLYKGANGVAAEFGHMFTHPSSYYESFASTTALVNEARQADPSCVNGRTLFELIQQGNEQLGGILNRWIDEVSLGLASLIHIFNPAAIVVGGGVMEQLPLVERVEARTKSLIMSSFAGVSIRPAALGNKAGLLGAASLFLS
ncbi:ROK family protein [Paenibacillus sp. JDR-2]|uniref:ROK family protein n=1 Tax=Paenibacillus sp. (strain JDR-2) TaxID=324057 RepID=UPI000166ACBD|nr:ROK family protein [Paenibacillus sp. JDR-2]ACT04816.1 ROK family protein [Paenibacillus sp. JDR-2]